MTLYIHLSIMIKKKIFLKVFFVLFIKSNNIFGSLYTENKDNKDPQEFIASKIMLASNRNPEIVDLQDEEPYCDYIFKGKSVYSLTMSIKLAYRIHRI